MSELLPRNFVRVLRLVVALATLLLGAGEAAADGNVKPPAPSFQFALIGDPQIGYGPGGEYGDTGRFREVVDALNARGVPLVIVPGDLVHDRSFWQKAAFDSVRSDLRARALLIPGNHDVVDLASLEDYREAYGRDYYVSVHENCAFVLLNSETARDPRLSQSEFDAQWRFIEETLAQEQRAGRSELVLVMHRPPFVSSETEPEDGKNWPPATRARLLAAARRHGVRWILAGHLHRTLRTATEDGIKLVVVAGSARNFDDSPIGYELFRRADRGLERTWVTVAESPPRAVSVPGFPEWTPRVFAFSPRYWFFTLIYAGTAWLALRTARTLARDARGQASSRLWRAIGWFLVFFAANTQLDFDEALREIGRAAAKVSGIYPIRHLVTGAALAVLGVAAVFVLARLYFRSQRERSTTVALAMLIVPAAWFALSTVSHHDIRMVFDILTWDILTLLALATIAVSARVRAKGTSGGGKPASPSGSVRPPMVRAVPYAKRR